MSTSASPKLDDPAPLLPTKVFEGHASAVRWVAYFHDGKRIISGSRDQTVRIWDIARQEQNGASLKHDSQVNSIALSPDERRLVSGGMGVVLWDLEGRAVMWKKEKEEVDGLCVAYSPDGRLVAARHHEAIVLLNAETGEQIRDPLQFGEPVSCLAFSPDGTRLAAGSHPGNVREFDVATGETVVGPFKVHTKRATSLVYALDGQQFITASHDKSIRVSDAVTGQETGDPMLGHESWISQIALSRDGQRLASSSADAIVCVWDLRTRQQIGSPLQSQDHSNLLSVAWSMEDRSIVAGRLDGKIFLWDIPSLNDHSVIPQALAPTTSSPSLPSMSRSRANSTPSSILSLPAGSSPIPPQFPEANTVPDEDDDWEYSTTGSFDSVLDAPADGIQPAQRRKRHRRRGAYATPHSSPPIPVVPNILANAEPESRPPQSQALPPSRNVAVETPAAAPIVTPASRFGPLTRFWMKITAAARRTRKLPRKNINEPAQLPGSPNEMQKSQGDAEENPSESRQVNDSRPRKRRWRRERRNNEVGMIAPAPGYDRYHSATEEYWYDPQNPPLIDRIFFCMICCGVPQDGASYKTNADLDPEPNVPTTNAQAGPSHSQNQPVPSAANTTTSANANASTRAPRLGRFGRLWRRISNAVRRAAHRQQPESHQLQNISHAAAQPSCHTIAPTSSGHATPTSSGHAAPQSSSRTTPASSHYETPTFSHYAMPTPSSYAMPTSPGSVAEQLNQNIRWTG